jgi:hypothetical protein
LQAFLARLAVKPLEQQAVLLLCLEVGPMEKSIEVIASVLSQSGMPLPQLLNQLEKTPTPSIQDWGDLVREFFDIQFREDAEGWETTTKALLVTGLHLGLLCGSEREAVRFAYVLFRVISEHGGSYEIWADTLTSIGPEAFRSALENPMAIPVLGKREVRVLLSALAS